VVPGVLEPMLIVKGEGKGIWGKAAIIVAGCSLGSSCHWGGRILVAVEWRLVKPRGLPRGESGLGARKERVGARKSSSKERARGRVD